MNNPVEFQPFPKMARLNRECIITEKIDGTNACIFIPESSAPDCPPQEMFVGSRTRWITPQDDNYGFAKWAHAHREELLTLGPGRHFGEWWGGGIQRGYGLLKGQKRFSLFNVQRFCLYGEPRGIISVNQETGEAKFQQGLPSCVGLVPVLYRGLFSTAAARLTLAGLAMNGSQAVPGYTNPEGIVVFHTAANVGFKVTILNDDQPKGRNS